MSPQQFLQALGKRPPAAAYLFIGPEPHQRDLCRKALIDRALTPEEVEDGLTRHDLSETSLASVLDDARSLSLFASNRVLWVSAAEAALPKKLTESAEDAAVSGLAKFLRGAPPGVTVVFDCSRFEFEGDDKPKLERVQKFYSPIPDQVEFRPYAPEAVRRLAQDRVRELGLQLGVSELGYLVESLGGDGARVLQELEKLSLYAGRGRKVTLDDIQQLVPNAQATTIFALVNALARGDRRHSLEALDTLLRDGEYLPMALTFLGNQFRLALSAREANLRNAQQIQAHFTKMGIRIWPDRAQQVQTTMAAFSNDKLSRAIQKVFEADRALRDVRPDDRVVMEELVMSLTA